MDKEEESLKSRLNKLEDILMSTKNTLSSLIDYQISLETNLQELIQSKRSETIAIKSASKINFLPVHEILYCTASLSYTEIISINNNKIFATKSINEFEDLFLDYSFFRISKSLLINTKYIHSYDRRTGQVLMKNQDLLDVARRRKTEFLSNIITI